MYLSNILSPPLAKKWGGGQKKFTARSARRICPPPLSKPWRRPCKHDLVLCWNFAEIVHSNVGERVCLTWTASEFHENFRIVEFDRCIAGSREARENDRPPDGTSLF